MRWILFSFLVLFLPCSMQASNLAHQRGSNSPRVTLVEYGDLDCPFCRRHHSTMKTLLEEYPDDIRWEFQHFPLSSHPHALEKAWSAECAADLGGSPAFWDIVDSYYEVPDFELEFESFARKHGIHPVAFGLCLLNPVYENRIHARKHIFATEGIESTPTTVILRHATDSRYTIEGAQPLDAFRTLLIELLR